MKFSFATQDHQVDSARVNIGLRFDVKDAYSFEVSVLGSKYDIMFELKDYLKMGRSFADNLALYLCKKFNVCLCLSAEAEDGNADQATNRRGLGSTGVWVP